eukprot:133140_1
MGNKKSRMVSNKSASTYDKQVYYGAKSPLQFTLGVDKVVEYWIKQSGFTINEIPKDVFRFILKYTSFFDVFEFQKNVYWTISNNNKSIYMNFQKAYKTMGMCCYHNILFGSVLNGDIEFKCKVEMQEFSGRSGYGFSQKKDILSIGLVEPDYHEYLNQNMHTGKNNRCVFKHNRYYDCKGNIKQYSKFFYSISNIKFELGVSVNMKQHTFSITDMDGNTATIYDIPDQRVICFEVWPQGDAIIVSDQSLQWVS